VIRLEVGGRLSGLGRAETFEDDQRFMEPHGRFVMVAGREGASAVPGDRADLTTVLVDSTPVTCD